MKTFIAGVALAIAMAAPAFAWEGHIVACYDKVYVPAEFRTSKTLIMSAHTEWEHRNGQMVRVHYPAVYKENRHLVTPAHYVARQAPCN